MAQYGTSGFLDFLIRSGRKRVAATGLVEYAFGTKPGNQIVVPSKRDDAIVALAVQKKAQLLFLAIQDIYRQAPAREAGALGGLLVYRAAEAMQPARANAAIARSAAAQSAVIIMGSFPWGISHPFNSMSL